MKLIVQEKKSFSLFCFFIFVSILVHVQIWLLWQKELVSEQKPEEIFSVTVDLKKNKKKSPKKTTKKIQTKAAKKTLKDFLPQNKEWSEMLTNKETPKSRQKMWEEDVQDLPFNQRIWEKIDSALYFPDIFNYFLLEGVLKAEIYLKPDGTLWGSPKVFEQGKRHSEKFLYAVLKEALADPLPKAHWGKNKKNYVFDLKFDFYITYKTYEDRDIRTQPIDHQKFFFYRKAFNKNKSPIEKALPPFLGGGSQINLVGLYMMLSGEDKKLKKRKLKELEAFYDKNSRK